MPRAPWIGMDKRPDEDHVDYARRCVAAGESEQRVSFEMNLSAGVVVALAEALPEGMSIQDLLRASVASMIASCQTRSIVIADDEEDLSEALEQLTDSVHELAESIHVVEK